ncbi:hypothetical protein BKA61DRAFT_474263 [Leptodontidium sp. MPI-SDFR-AT-0119]|nr:hypothetical protein BKA61DRAFT_474263 [Leptodontidium sp. MPI-SDFR-AT-0119]
MASLPAISGESTGKRCGAEVAWLTLTSLPVSECEPTRPTRLSTIPPSDPSASRRSLSIQPSIRSSRSRITLVGYDESLEPKFESEYGASSDAGRYSWLDHLLAVFCIPRRPTLEPARTAVPESPPRYQDPEVHVASPWVLPVYVLSTERDQSRHMIPREAKCTIDTGNLQGNIVSREFVVGVLGYTKNDFHKLTREEEDGGQGITGHKLIPVGAIYLTWYHSNSTRVFRDMRFLVSEHPMFDLIIGARSIQKNNILDVPNLMSSGTTIWSTFLDEDITNGMTTSRLIHFQA